MAITAFVKAFIGSLFIGSSLLGASAAWAQPQTSTHSNPESPSLHEVQQLATQFAKAYTALLERNHTPSDHADTNAAEVFWIKQIQRPAFTQRYQQLSERLATPAQDPTQRLNLYEGFTQLLKDFEAGEGLYEAVQVAQKARGDLMMYRMMKHVKTPGPELQRAHAIFAHAEQAMHDGHLALALACWHEVQLAFNERAFQEVIDGFIAAGDARDQRAQERLADIRNEVNRLLNNHFVVLAGGTFERGSHTGDSDERPVATVTLEPFKLGKTEVTFALWDLCVEVRSCHTAPNDGGWGRGDRPVINISYQEITEQFLPWLALITGKTYRLPTETEWEYAARSTGALSPTDCSQARFDGGFGSACPAQQGGHWQGPAPVMQYPANALGLYDLQGNVWEWVASCYTPSYDEPAPKPCKLGVVRGGSWKDGPSAMRASNRFYYPRHLKKPTLGFRLVEVTDQ